MGMGLRRHTERKDMPSISSGRLTCLPRKYGCVLSCDFPEPRSLLSGSTVVYPFLYLCVLQRRKMTNLFLTALLEGDLGQGRSTWALLSTQQDCRQLLALRGAPCCAVGVPAGRGCSGTRPSFGRVGSCHLVQLSRKLGEKRVWMGTAGKKSSAEGSPFLSPPLFWLDVKMGCLAVFCRHWPRGWSGPIGLAESLSRVSVLRQHDNAV